MQQATLITRVNLDCKKTTDLISRNLMQGGFDVMRSFDLQAARASQLDCPCPHHGTEKCTCQVVILLVYGNDPCPMTLIVHSLDETTHISLVENPQQNYSTIFRDIVENALTQKEA